MADTALDMMSGNEADIALRRGNYFDWRELPYSERNRLNSNLAAAFVNYLRFQNPDLTTQAFGIVYAAAREAGHASGYAEVEMFFNDYLSMIREFNAAS